nr:MAG: hypothetical protein DIU57_18640 [Pseudomonadota bacterium]
MSLTTPDLLECADAEHFVRLCREELKRYPRSPVVVTSQTAKDIDISGIMRLTPDEIDALLEAEVGRVA